jgi:hypothetical protein
MLRKYWGPFAVHIDDDNQVVSVTLERCGPTRWQLLKPEIEKLREYVLKRAGEYGYSVVEV